MSTAVVYGLDDDDEDDVGDEDDDNDDDSVMLVSEKPAARPPPGKKAPFKCVPGEVLRVMQDRLASNASKNNTVVNLMPTLPGSQDLLEACMTQVSLENNNRSNK